MMNNNIKVNLHICEYCNYHCAHCFAKFGCKATLPLENWKNIVDNIVSSGLVREINIAGGEPMIHHQMSEIVDYIRTYNIPVSLVTNGSLMTEEWIRKNGRKFKTIGFSVDALTPELQRTVGRCTNSGVVISPESFGRKIALLREVNPDIKIKINTVVSQVNKLDNIADFIKEWNVDRWKLLKMQIFDDGVHCNESIKVSDSEYDSYVSRSLKSLGQEFIHEKIQYQAGTTQVIAERLLMGGYIMVGANGFLLDDTKNSSYTKVCDCQTESFAEGLKKLTFFEEVYKSRY